MAVFFSLLHFRQESPALQYSQISASRRVKYFSKTKPTQSRVNFPHHILAVQACLIRSNSYTNSRRIWTTTFAWDR